MTAVLAENAAALRTEPLRLEVVSDTAAFLQLEQEWNALVAHTEIDHPFLTFDWVRSWWECFGAGDRLHIVVVREGPAAIAIAPLMVTRRMFYGLSMRCMQFIANVHTPRFDILVAARHPEVHRALWEHLNSVRDLWDVLLLCQIPEGSLTLEYLSRFAEDAGFPVAPWKSADSPYVRLLGDWEGYLGNLRPKHRTNLRRRMRRLQELGPVSFEMISAGDPLDFVLGDGFRLEGAVWKDSNRTAIQSDAAVEQFYRTVATRFAKKDWLKLHFLKLGDRRIAFQYAVSFKDKAFSLKPGYDPAYAQCSPSNLLCMLFLERLCQAGVTEYDFLGVEEEWKMQWAQATRAHYWLFVFSNALLPSLLYSLKFRWIPSLRQKRTLRRLGHVVAAMRHHLSVTGVSA